MRGIGNDLRDLRPLNRKKRALQLKQSQQIISRHIGALRTTRSELLSLTYIAVPRGVPTGRRHRRMASLEAFAAQLGQIEVLSEHLYNSTVRVSERTRS